MPQIKGMKSMKKDDFFFQYKYDYELSARLKKRHGWMPHHWKKILIFCVAAFVISLFFGKIDLSAIIFLIAFVVFLLCAAVYIFAQTMIRPCCKKCGKRMLKKYISTGCNGEEQLYFYCPDCRIYSDAYISWD